MKRPPLRYHGGKFRLAPWIISHFPDHQIYVEPFGGGASVLLRKPRSKSEVYNDLDGHIVSLFQVMQDPAQAERLKRLLYYTPYSRDEFYLAWQGTDDPVESAKKTLVRSHMGFGSAGATCGSTGFRSDASRTNSSPASTWANLADHLDSFVARLRGVTIENVPASECIRLHDRETTLFYVDPPYMFETRGMGHQTYYRHEMTDAQHEELLKQLLGVSGQVVLSGYDNDLYNDLLGGWAKHSKKSLASGHRGAVERIELLWTNGDADRRLHAATIDLFTQEG